MSAKTKTKKKTNDKTFKNVMINGVDKKQTEEQVNEQVNEFENLEKILEFLNPKFNINLFIEVRLMSSDNQDIIKINHFTKIINLPFNPMIGMVLSDIGQGSNKQITTILYSVQNNVFICGLKPEIVFTDDSFERTVNSYIGSGWKVLT